MLTVVFASCGSSKANCDAYGCIDQLENTDLASR